MKPPALVTARAAAALLLLALLGCSGPDSRRGTPVETPKDEPPAPLVLDTRGGLAPAGRGLAEALLEKCPEARAGRLAVGWNPRFAWLLPISQGFALAWPSTFLLEDLGVQASRAEEAFNQLDPAGFSGLLWIEPAQTQAGDLDFLDVELRATGRSHVFRARFACHPPIRLSADAQARPAAQPLILWMVLDDPPGAMAWESGRGRLWVAGGEAIERIDPSSRRPLQRWGLPSLPEGAKPGRQVLQEVRGGGGGLMGWFDLAKGQGRLYEEGAGGLYEPAGAVEGLPLPEKVQRFFTAPYDPETSEFVVQDFRGQALGRCVDLARFAGEGVTLFALLASDGSLRGLRGSDLALMSGPPVTASAVCSWERLLLAASANPPYQVIGFRPTERGDWATVWSSPPLPGPAACLCAGNLQGAPTLFAAVGRDGRTEVFAVALPPR